MTYTTQMERYSFNTLRSAGPLRLALALALLLATNFDVGHQHDNPTGELECYTCHFSPDKGLTAEIHAPGPVSYRVVRIAPVRSAPTLAARAALHTARGSPLAA